MKKFTKILLNLSFSFALIAAPLSVNAQSPKTACVKYMEDDFLYETVTVEYESNGLIDSPRSAYKTKSGSKTTTCKSSSGQSLWSVTVNATFQYNGSQALCAYSSVSTQIYDSSWKISDKSSSRSANSATAKATGRRYSDTTLIQTIEKSVTLSCSKTGTLT